MLVIEYQESANYFMEYLMFLVIYFSYLLSIKHNKEQLKMEDVVYGYVIACLFSTIPYTAMFLYTTCIIVDILFDTKRMSSVNVPLYNIKEDLDKEKHKITFSDEVSCEN